jgi:hypothetical protein
MPTWYQIVTDNFTRANTAPGGAGTTTGAGNNWIDVQGGVWSILSNTLSGLPDSVNTSQYERDFLSRPSWENQTDQKIVFSCVGPSTGGWSGAINAALRLQSNANHDCYFALMDASQVAFFSFVGGTLTQIATHSITYTAGHNYQMTAQITGTSPTSYSVTLVDTTTSTTLGSVSGTDSTSGLQTSGAYALNINGGATSATITYTLATTYGDVPGIIVGPNTASVSTNETITLTGLGTSWTSGTTFSISGGSGATLNGGTSGVTPTSFNLANQTATFTLAPGSTAATLTISDSVDAYTGTVTVSGPPVNISPTSTARIESPGFWVNASGGRTGGTSRQTWRVGSWVKYYWSTTSGSPTCTLNMSNPTSASEITIAVNGVQTDGIAVPSSGGINLSSYLSGAGSYELQVWFRNSPLSSRWAYGNALVDAGITVDSSSTPGTAPSLRPWAMIIGDSITEGINTINTSTSDNLVDHSFLLSQTLDQLGYDYSINACGGWGYLMTGDTSVGGDVPAWYLVDSGGYEPASSSWNKIDGSNSLLDSASQISAYGSTGTTPALITINFGTNEAISGANTTYLTTAVTDALTSLRTAAPNAQIRVILFFGAYTSWSGGPSLSTVQSYATAVRNGVANYLSANPNDTRTKLIDLGSIASTYLMSLTANNLHPEVNGQAFAAAALAGLLTQALVGSARGLVAGWSGDI